MTYTRLIYGTLVAATLVGGTVWYLDTPRSTAKAIDAYTLAEKVAVRRAAVSLGGWPFTNSVSTNVGWYATTNALTATNWSYNGYTVVPYFGSVIPRAFINETLDQIKAVVPYFVDSVTTNPVFTTSGITNGYEDTYALDFVMLTVTGLWARLGIGDGTNLWTVGYQTNGVPIYSNHIGSVLITQTLYEANSVLTNLYWTQYKNPEYSSSPYLLWSNDTKYSVSDVYVSDESDYVYPDFGGAAETNYTNFFGWVRFVWTQYQFGTNYWYDAYYDDGVCFASFAQFPTNVSATLHTVWVSYNQITPDIKFSRLYGDQNDAIEFPGLGTNLFNVTIKDKGSPPVATKFLTLDDIKATNTWPGGFEASAYYVWGESYVTWNFND